MIRKILAVVGGYVAMAVFVMVTFSIAYLIIGVEASYRPDSYDVSAVWIVISITLSVVGAILGGFVCAVIAKDGQVAKILAGIVFVIGLALALVGAAADRPEPEPRGPDVSVFEAMNKSRQPLWISFLNPLIGAVGIICGGMLWAGRNRTDPPES